MEHFSRGVAQPGSAPALGAGGLEFESPRPDQIYSNQQVTEIELWYCCIVVQLGNNKNNSLGLNGVEASPKQMQTLRVGQASPRTK